MRVRSFLLGATTFLLVMGLVIGLSATLHHGAARQYPTGCVVQLERFGAQRARARQLRQQGEYDRATYLDYVAAELICAFQGTNDKR